MKLIYLFITLFCLAQSFAVTTLTTPDQGRQIYNISNIKNSEKEAPKQEITDLENL